MLEIGRNTLYYSQTYNRHIIRSICIVIGRQCRHCKFHLLRHVCNYHIVHTIIDVNRICLLRSMSKIVYDSWDMACWEIGVLPSRSPPVSGSASPAAMLSSYASKISAGFFPLKCAALVIHSRNSFFLLFAASQRGDSNRILKIFV
jgi:hypothetical protein